jgi:hypothetical protein
MIAPHCHEITRLRSQLDAAERELDHRANVISDLADALTATRIELDAAVALGQHYYEALRAAIPSSPAGVML